MAARGTGKVRGADARGEIANLMASYAEALDAARFDDLGRLFSEGNVTISGGPQHGSHAQGEGPVADLYRSIVAVDNAGRTGTRHFLTNFFIEVDDGAGTAIGRSYFAVTQQTAVLPLQLVACGAYHDSYGLHDERWVFRSRHIMCEQVGELSEHMR